MAAENARGRAYVEAMVNKARSGDNEAREQLLSEFTPFILGVASRVCGRYVRPGQDDEVSVGMMAFNEAIDQYDRSQRAGFLSFAELVIRRRLIDYYRREKAQQVPDERVEDEPDWDKLDGKLLTNQTDGMEAVEFRDEIKRFSQALQRYGVSLSSLAKTCPRHQDARQRAQDIARFIAANPKLSDYVRRRRTIPSGDVASHVGVSKRTVERQRNYILAVYVVLNGDYPLMTEYVTG